MILLLRLWSKREFPLVPASSALALLTHCLCIHPDPHKEAERPWSHWMGFSSSDWTSHSWKSFCQCLAAYNGILPSYPHTSGWWAQTSPSFPLISGWSSWTAIALLVVYILLTSVSSNHSQKKVCFCQRGSKQLSHLETHGLYCY